MKLDIINDYRSLQVTILVSECRPVNYLIEHFPDASVNEIILFRDSDYWSPCCIDGINKEIEKRQQLLLRTWVE